MDSRRGPPHVGGSHWLSTDIIYQPGSSSGNSSRVIRMDEAGESSSGGRGFYRQDCGKGPESSRPPIHKPAAQFSSKLVATRSSGARRMQRAQQGSLQGPWNVLQSYPGGLNDPALECTGMDVPGSSATEYFPSRRGHVTEHIGAWNGMSGVPPLGSRQAQAGADVAYPRVSIGSIGIEERQGGDVGGSMSFNSLNSFYRDHQDFLNEGRSGFNEKRADDSSGSVTYNSLYVDHPNYMDEGNLQASSSNYAHSAQVEAFWAAASKHHASLDTHVACRSNVFPISTERHSLRSNLPGKTSESGASSSGNASSTSRSSACKRKSCTPVAAGSSSSQSIAGCTSASDVGASTSSSAEATCRGLGFVPLVGTGTEDPRTSHFGSETELLLEARRDSRAGKNAVSSSSTSGNPHGFTQVGPVGVVLMEAGAVQPPAPFARTVRRAVPGLSPETWGSSRTPLIDSAMDADNSISTTNLLVDQMLSSSPPLCHGSPSVIGGRGGPPASLRRTPSSPCPLRPPPHPPIPRSRLQGSTTHMSIFSPSSSGAAPSRLAHAPPFNPSVLAPSIDSLPSAATLLQRSMLPRPSASGVRDRGLSSVAESLLGMPFRGLHMSAGEGAHQPRLAAEGLAEILLALERVERDEDLTYEQLLMLEATLLFGGMGLHDQHSDLRLDVDNMSYEELLALEERIGNVSTGVTAEVAAQKLKRSQYSSLDAMVAHFSEECDIKCSICQEEYVEGDELGKIDCGHGYHVSCIQQWLVQKNQCPICKATALS
ncbi:unnamed protein product [Sphagnum troendelagicum]|uniref:RING-type E3 ubiquitin transferase n=1 Tax=Sphagnum troendelagicum TaxID=128251 RepID=A0ABP0U806_9BRYO